MRRIKAERQPNRAAAAGQEKAGGSGIYQLFDPQVVGADDSAGALGLLRRAGAECLGAIRGEATRADAERGPR